MTSNSMRMLAVAIGLALLAGGWWLGQRSANSNDASGTARGDAAPTVLNSDAGASGDATADADTDATAASSGPSSAPIAATTPNAPPLPLPPPDTPIAEMLDSLLERARRGDAGAACRLASELQRCREHAMREGFRQRDIEARVAGERDDERRESMIQAMARMEVERERATLVCAEVTDAQIALAFPLQMQAAQARPELRTWLAINPALDTRFFLDNMESWQQYRQVAMPWMEAAAAEGDLSALIALARVHGDERSFGPPIPPFRELDDERFLAYATLLERYGMSMPPVQRAAEEARRRIDPARLAAAEARADALFRPEAVVASDGAPQRALRGSFQRAPQAADCE